MIKESESEEMFMPIHITGALPAAFCVIGFYKRSEKKGSLSMTSLSHIPLSNDFRYAALSASIASS